MDTTLVALFMLILLMLLLCSGLWIGLGILLTGMIGIALFASAPVWQVTVTTMWGDSAEWTLTALPMFIWMGEILFRTSISQSLFNGLAPWLSRIPGRLLHVNVVGCALFGSISGSSTATCATIAKIALPQLTARKYPEAITLGSLASAGTLGILIPPSVIMIVYAVAADVSILEIFRAGVIPGLIASALFSGYIAVWALLNPTKIPKPERHYTFLERIKATRELIPCLLLILGVAGGMFTGFATATEVGAVGVVGSLIVAKLGGSLTWQTFKDSAYGALRISCMIALILAGSTVLSVSMAFTGIPKALAAWVASLHLTPYMLVTALCVVYIILGTALEGVAMILLTTTITLPLVVNAGFDPVWFGIFIVLMTEIAALSPPVGFNLFVMQSFTGRSSGYVAWATLPFVLMLVATVAIISVFPITVSWLPMMLRPT